VGEKPGHYWDLNECGWVRYPVPQPVVVPAQPDAADAELPSATEADVRSG